MRKAQKYCHPHNPSFKSVKLFMSGIWKRNSFTPVNLSFASKPSSLLFFGDNDCLSSFQFMSVFCCYKSTIIIRGGFSLVFITWNMEKNTFSSVLLSHLVWSNQPRKLRRVFRWCNEKINCLLKQFWKRIPLSCPSFLLGDGDQFMDFRIWKIHFPSEVIIISKFWHQLSVWAWPSYLTCYSGSVFKYKIR